MSEWETSKENVQPLKRGRSVKVLNDVMSKETEHLENEKKKFEKEILSSKTSTDPLDSWVKYFKWIRDAYPSDTKMALTILERCTFEFKAEEHYKNDIRFIQMWIEYANLVRTPGEIFSFMNSNKIGSQVALFWVAWAFVTEKLENFKLTDQIFQKGLKRKAEPLKLLQTRYQQFQRRLARHYLNTSADMDGGLSRGPDNVTGFEGESGSGPGPQRRALGQLSAPRPQDENNSRGAAVPRSGRDQGFGAGSRGAAGSSNGNGNGALPFVVFEEPAEADRAAALSLHENSGWRVLAPDAVRRKENQGPVTKWSDGPVLGGGAPLLPSSSVPVVPIFVDTEAESGAGGVGASSSRSSGRPNDVSRPTLRVHLDAPAATSVGAIAARPLARHTAETASDSGPTPATAPTPAVIGTAVAPLDSAADVDRVVQRGPQPVRGSKSSTSTQEGGASLPMPTKLSEPMKKIPVSAPAPPATGFSIFTDSGPDSKATAPAPQSVTSSVSRQSQSQSRSSHGSAPSTTSRGTASSFDIFQDTSSQNAASKAGSVSIFTDAQNPPHVVKVQVADKENSVKPPASSKAEEGDSPMLKRNRSTLACRVDEEEEEELNGFLDEMGLCEGEGTINTRLARRDIDSLFCGSPNSPMAACGPVRLAVTKGACSFAVGGALGNCELSAIREVPDDDDGAGRFPSPYALSSGVGGLAKGRGRNAAQVFGCTGGDEIRRASSGEGGSGSTDTDNDWMVLDVPLGRVRGRIVACGPQTQTKEQVSTHAHAQTQLEVGLLPGEATGSGDAATEQLELDGKGVPGCASADTGADTAPHSSLSTHSDSSTSFVRDAEEIEPESPTSRDQHAHDSPAISNSRDKQAVVLKLEDVVVNEDDWLELWEELTSVDITAPKSMGNLKAFRTAETALLLYRSDLRKQPLPPPLKLGVSQSTGPIEIALRGHDRPPVAVTMRRLLTSGGGNGLLGRGAFGYVLHCELEVASAGGRKGKGSTTSEVALKVCRQQRSSLLWEALLFQRAIQRLAALSSSSPLSLFLNLFAPPLALVLLQDAALAVLPLVRLGSLHDLCNVLHLPPLCHSLTAKEREILVAVLSVQMVQAVDVLHSAHIIHCDIKPDNWMLGADSASTAEDLKYSLGVKLIDLGKGKDLTKCEAKPVVVSRSRSRGRSRNEPLAQTAPVAADVTFPKGCRGSAIAAYVGSTAVSGFECVEMREGDPWNYSADCFGLAACLHQLLFGAALELEVRAPRAAAARRGWELSGDTNAPASASAPGWVHAPRSSVRRYWNSLWGPLLAQLLNHGSLTEPANMDVHVARLQAFLRSCGHSSVEGVLAKVTLCLKST